MKEKIEFLFEKVDKLWILTIDNSGVCWGRPSRTKAEVVCLRELHRWLEGETTFKLVAEKEILCPTNNIQESDIEFEIQQMDDIERQHEGGL